MKPVLTSLLIVAFALGFAACKNEDTPTANAGEAVVSGQVLNAVTGKAVPVVQVAAGSQTTVTDSSGMFTLRFGVDSVAAVMILFTKDQYNDTSLVLQVREGDVLTVQMKMNPFMPVGGGSGLAQTIAFLGAAPQEISVYGVGGTETSLLGWEVRDSLGLPITESMAVDLNFQVVNGPGGGEYVSPSVVRTGSSGQAYTTMNAGTKSGVAQIVARATVGARIIQSTPVRVIINGGFPVQDHFTVAAPTYNFPALNWVGRELPVSVLAGDMYSNPVAPRTAVYFRSSAGVVQPSVFTNKDGQGTVTLFSGNPYPYGAYAAAAPLDTGYHYVVAKTVGQNGITVTDSILVLWSGYAGIWNVSPSTFDIANGGSDVFAFVVSDRFFHPLAAGSEISVTATVPPPASSTDRVNQVQVGFGIGGRIVLEDYLFRGPGRTDFSFRLSDGSTDVTQATPVTVTISVKGANGTALVTLTGIVR